MSNVKKQVSDMFQNRNRMDSLIEKNDKNCHVENINLDIILAISSYIQVVSDYIPSNMHKLLVKFGISQLETVSLSHRL